MNSGFQSIGTSTDAFFTLKLHRGDGMLLLAMNWRQGIPPRDFVGFGIQYREPGGTRFFDLKNRLGFLTKDGKIDTSQLSTMRSPIQKFRWVHFPRNAEMEGNFTYRVTPVFMNETAELSYGAYQEAQISLRRETYPGQLNVSFTRGFVSSQAFVDRYLEAGPIDTLLPPKADDGLKFVPTHPKATEALAWMGFEARREILALLDEAAADNAQVRVIAYDLSEPQIVNRLEALGPRLKIIIDDDGPHKPDHSGESQAAARLMASAGAANVKRQHMGKLQHNKVIVVEGPTLQKALGGSTNYSWRGFYVQANNAVFVQGASAIKPFKEAFDAYWQHDKVSDFAATPSALWHDLGLQGIDAKVTFSPHSQNNAQLKTIGEDVGTAKSNLFYSLAFLAQTGGEIRDAIEKAILSDTVFVYGMSDRELGGIELLKPDGNSKPVYPSALTKNAPSPFKEEPKGGGGTRMHHKFIVVDFDQPNARVYLGSYNFSKAADTSNGENLFVIRDRRVATSYMIEAVRLFDHYHFRIAKAEATKAKTVMALKKPPTDATTPTWFDEDYIKPQKIKDRLLFA
jgi:phosphatidylserine/phosphatidylglycerophosphate/cardiolipin synthase-like enzyme